MSKSIYDEVLEIMVNSVLPRESSKTNKLKVIKALEQAQKQEKLLELYKRLYKDFDDLTLDEQLEIEKQIKEKKK